MKMTRSRYRKIADYKAVRRASEPLAMATSRAALSAVDSLVVSVCSLSLCGNMRQPPSLSLRDRTLCILRCAQGRPTGFPLVAITTGLFVFLLYAQYNNITRLWGQAGASRLKKHRTTTSRNTRAQLSGQGRSRAVAELKERRPPMDVQA